jgi:hypothetical protein
MTTNDIASFLALLEKSRDVEELKAKLRLLLPLEQEVLNILYHSPHPLAAKEIVNEIINKLWEEAARVFWEHRSALEKELKKFPHTFSPKVVNPPSFNEILNPQYHTKTPFDEHFDRVKSVKVVLWKNTFFPGKVETTLGVLKDVAEGIDYSKPPHEIIAQKRARLTKSKLVSIPDPRRIEKVTEDLEALGLVVSRPLTGRKAKRVYALHPEAYKLFSRIYEKKSNK